MTINYNGTRQIMGVLVYYVFHQTKSGNLTLCCLTSNAYFILYIDDHSIYIYNILCIVRYDVKEGFITILVLPFEIRIFGQHTVTK